MAMCGNLNRGGSARVSVHDVVVKAAGLAQRQVPSISVVRSDRVDIAVTIPGPSGLVAPVVRDVATRNISAVPADLADLAVDAGGGSLTPCEFDDGVLAVADVGIYGIDECWTTVDPPQSAMLAVGAVRQEPVVESGAILVCTVMHVTLSVDQRFVDRATAAEWMRAFLDTVTNPIQILM
jgi:pyruvate dehydrogenase E2 component (dihydrolipoamide acetyltransferase)